MVAAFMSFKRNAACLKSTVGARRYPSQLEPTPSATTMPPPGRENHLRHRGRHQSECRNRGPALHVEDAVDRVDLAGDVGRLRIVQELHHPGHLVGLAE